MGGTLLEGITTEILGIKQPRVSLLTRNRSCNFMVERLMDFLTALGHNVEIRVKGTRSRTGRCRSS